ncbi:hypothetical protein JXE04_00670 [Patescibacteria group bacterium]|nr:hypothetical protein [Patescibacteria group bacterium]
MKVIINMCIGLITLLFLFSCSISEDNQNTLNTEQKYENYLDFYSSIHKMLAENAINPSTELTLKIAKLEDEAFKKYPEYMLKAEAVEVDSNSSRNTTDRYTWKDSVQAMGSFGFVTIWWTEPYVASDFYYYGINRRVDGSAYYYRIKTSYDKYFDYYRDYNVSSNTYYYYYVKLMRTGGYYLGSNAIRTWVN